MKFSILINNFNYAPYLIECVESVLHQTDPAHEIIIVDDGSTDNSLAVLEKNYKNHPKIRIIPQLNGGQAAAFATGIEAATGDVYCFLDSDDRYKKNYLESLRACYAQNPLVDFIYCRRDIFGPNPTNLRDSNLDFLENHTSDYDWGYTALLVYFGSKYWIGGNSTSTLSLKRKLIHSLDFKKISQAYCRNHADNLLVTGASLMGGRKYFLNQALIEYRLHGKNISCQPTPENTHPDIIEKNYQGKKYNFWLFAKTQWNFYRKLSNISDNMAKSLLTELKSVPQPHPEHVKMYQQTYQKKYKINFIRKIGRHLKSSF